LCDGECRLVSTKEQRKASSEFNKLYRHVHSGEEKQIASIEDSGKLIELYFDRNCIKLTETNGRIGYIIEHGSFFSEIFGEPIVEMYERDRVFFEEDIMETYEKNRGIFIYENEVKTVLAFYLVR
jgi:hypothetical protein